MRRCSLICARKLDRFRGSTWPHQFFQKEKFSSRNVFNICADTVGIEGMYVQQPVMRSLSAQCKCACVPANFQSVAASPSWYRPKRRLGAGDQNESEQLDAMSHTDFPLLSTRCYLATVNISNSNPIAQAPILATDLLRVYASTADAKVGASRPASTHKHMPQRFMGAVHRLPV